MNIGQDIYKRTALSIAASMDNTDMMLLLFEFGAEATVCVVYCHVHVHVHVLVYLCRLKR